MKVLGSVLLAVVAMFVQAFLGVLPALLIVDQAGPLWQPLGALGVTLTALLLVYLIRRFIDRRPWSALGWRNPAGVLAGLLAGAVPVLAANGLSLAAGASTWVPVDASAYAGLALAAVVILLNQAFPEELLWRGHLFDTLSARLSPRAVLLIVSVAFGVLHIVSQSPASGVLERLLYVVMATALGFACAAARVRAGGLWPAVGVHLGFHLGMRALPLQPVNYGLTLALVTVALVAAGFVLLGGRAGGRRAPQTGPVTSVSGSITHDAR